MTGRIIGLSCGIYSIINDGVIYKAPARGVFRKKNIKPVVGDSVEFDDIDFIITDVHERSSFLKRPPIANIDQMFIVTSLVDDIISPLLGLIGGQNFDSLAVNIGGVTLYYGKFITAIINFLLVALVLFLIIKALNSAKKAGDKITGKEKKPEEPTEKDCPYCLSKIPIKATRCPHCTSELK